MHANIQAFCCKFCCFSFFKAGYSQISALELWLMNLTSTTHWAPWMIDLFALQQIDVRFDVTEASKGSKNDHTRRFRSCYRALSSPIASSPSSCRLLIIAHTGFDFPDRVTVSLPSGVEVTFDLFNCVYNYGRAGISPLQRTRHVTYGATISWKWRGGRGGDSASAPCRSVTPGIPPPSLPPSLSTVHSSSPLHPPSSSSSSSICPFCCCSWVSLELNLLFRFINRLFHRYSRN